MRKKLELLAKGELELEQNIPQVFPAEIIKQIIPGERFKGEIHLRGSKDRIIRGIVYVKSPLITILTKEFEGEKNVIYYELSENSLNVCEVLKTSIYIETDGGEIEIPCHFIKENIEQKAEQGIPNSLGSLAEMAKEWPLGASMIFEIPEFKQQEFMQDEKLQLLYQALQKETSKEYFLEEFLLATNQKEPVAFELNQKQIDCQMRVGKTAYIVQIDLINWGNTRINISCESPFVFLETIELSNADFKQKKAEIHFYLDASVMHQGRNYAVIKVESSYCKEEIFINAQLNEIKKEESSKILHKDRADFTQAHIRLIESMWNKQENYWDTFPPQEKTALDFILEQMQKAIEKIYSAKSNSVYIQLLTAMVYALRGNTNKALDLLNPIKLSVEREKEKHPFYFALYLTNIVLLEKKESLNKILIEFLNEQLIEGKKEYDQLLLLAIQIDLLRRREVSKLYQEIRNYCLYHKSNRYFTAIAAKCLLEEPKLLERTGKFEGIVLSYLFRTNRMNQSIAYQMAVRISTGKKFSPLLFGLYTKLYAKFHTKELLMAICILLIRSDCQESRFFPWYENAVKEDLRITRLFDYYLYSLPSDFNQPLSRRLLLYYSYDQPVEIELCRLVYKNIMTFYLQDEEIYKRYEEVINIYVRKQLELNALDPRLMDVYTKILDIKLLTKEEIEQIYILCHMHKIVCEKQELRSIIVYEYGEKREVPLRKGMAWLPLYSTSYLLFFKDKYGQVLTKINYLDEQVENKDNWEEKCQLFIPDSPEILKSYFRQVMNKTSYTREDIVLFEQYLTDETISLAMKQKLLEKCVTYCVEKEELVGETSILLENKYLLSGKYLVDLMEIFIVHECYYEAYELVKENGYEFIEINRLFTLCRKLVNTLADKNEPFLLSAVYFLFEQGFTTTDLLKYLAKFYWGDCESMYQIVVSCRKEKIECKQLTKQLFVQLLFANAPKGLDELYFFCKEDKSLDFTLKKAYFVIKTYRYVLGKSEFSNENNWELDEIFTKRKETLPVSAKLAKIRFFAEQETLKTEELQQMKILLGEVKALGYRLLFMEKAAVRLGKSAIMLIESKPIEASRVFVRYKKNSSDKIYTEQMQLGYSGIFIKEVVLYSDEILNYQIFKEGSKEILEEGELKLPFYLQEGNNRYACLNRMLAAENKESLGRKYQEMNKFIEKNYYLL